MAPISATIDAAITTTIWLLNSFNLNRIELFREDLVRSRRTVYGREQFVELT
jgi:hypothetical protein